MKTRAILSAASILFVFNNSYAQIPNPDFELNNSCGLSANWSYMPLMAIIIDSIGNEHVDSIIYDGVNYLNYPVSDAHSGNYAMSIRNAYSYTYNQTYVGRSTLFPDSADCSAFYTNLLPVNYSPIEFSFFYKYFPVNGDTAYTRAILYDTLGNAIATAEELIIAAQPTYLQAVIPFNYSVMAPVAFYSIEFYNTNPDGYPHQSTLGTRLLIDDVSFTNNNSLNENIFLDWSIYPNPAVHYFQMKTNENILVDQISIVNMQGEMLYNYSGNQVNFDCSMLCNGLYLVKINTNKGLSTQKLLIHR